MSMGSMSDSLAMTMAFSAVPPMPMPSMPGGHQPAPMPGRVLSTQSTTESDGLSMAKRDLASEPPPLEATVMSTPEPATSSTTTMAGVLSPVLRRVKAGSSRMLGRRTLSALRQASRTPSSTICCMVIMPKVARGRPLDLHADLDEGGDDAGVLADGAMAFGAHARVDEDLRDGVLGGVRLLELIGAGEVGDVVDGVVEADVLERVGYGAG